MKRQRQEAEARGRGKRQRQEAGTASVGPAPQEAGTASVGPAPHEQAEHHQYPSTTPTGQVRVLGKLVPLAFSVLGGLGPEGVRELRSFFTSCGRSAAAVVPTLGRNVVLHTARSILRAFGTRAAARELA